MENTEKHGTSLDRNHLETLKQILDNSLQPGCLDSHPWTKSLIAQEAGAPDQSPGQRLIFALGKLFAGMMPSVAPRHGKRLDTRWGEFGILAAQYFAPIMFGTASPASLRDAWGRIDEGILYFVYGKAGDKLSQAEKDSYKLVGDELEVAPNSTLSDWHRKGLRRLMDAILAREGYLSKSLSKPAIINRRGQTSLPAQVASASSENQSAKGKLHMPSIRRILFLLLVIIMLGLVVVGGITVKRVYDQALLVRQEATNLRDITMGSAPLTQRIQQAGPALETLRQNFQVLEGEVKPYLWLGPWLGWVPTYGGDLASAPELMTLADSLLTSADQSYQVMLPLLNSYDASGFDPVKWVGILNQAQPQLSVARQNLDLALTARSNLNPDRLSPFLRGLILNDVDRVLPPFNDGLTLATEIPSLLGASNEGPKTYLLLVENADELRPTGGFITAAGNLLLQNGHITSLTFENSGDVDNWTMPYPVAPWQLSQYMNSPVLIFRDSNWFTNYPTTALYAEQLYSYYSAHSVNGVIAFDQQLLVELLGVIGPIQMSDVPYPIDASNIVAYMHYEKAPTAADLASPDWNNKIFMANISQVLIAKIFSGTVNMNQLSAVLLQALNEHHLLLQFDNPTMNALLVYHDWDGAVRPAGGDFLMVVDSNVGFDKTNAVVESNLSYDVDLTNPAAPVGSLTVIHKNYSVGSGDCIQSHWIKIPAPDEEYYPIEDCYYDYLRVYLPAGTNLLSATPQSIPARWMILQTSPASKVDVLNEQIPGVQTFGTIQVVPYGQSLTMSFRFGLPAGILKAQPGDGWMTYHLKVQKQPGTLVEPITINIHLPDNALVQAVPAGASMQGHNLLFQANLRTDLEIEVAFQIP
jgi:hypothetical protein